MKKAKDPAKTKTAPKAKPNKMPRRRLGAGGGALAMVALLFLGSGFIRLASGTGAAIALEIAGDQAGEDVAHDVAQVSAETCDADPDLDAYIEVLKERETAIAAREAAATEREAVLSKAKDELLQKLADLETAQERLSATVSTASVAAENDLTNLTSVYESMKPKDATPLFNAMEPDFAAGFLARMRPEAAAAIMSGLTPEKAYSISVVLAGRNAAIPLK